jgi:hypothetical protein
MTPLGEWRFRLWSEINGVTLTLSLLSKAVTAMLSSQQPLDPQDQPVKARGSNGSSPFSTHFGASILGQGV